MLGKPEAKEKEDDPAYCYDSAVTIVPSKDDDLKEVKERHPCTCRNWLNLIAYIVNTIVTYVSLTGVFGATPLETADKYQTLFTPARWTFAIWVVIFIWEGVFVIAQFCYCYRHCEFVVKCSPWWWGACVCQTFWVLVFAQEWVSLAGLLMTGILNCLLGVSWATDLLELTACEYFLLSAPLSLHLGWIIVASLLSLNVQADGYKSSQRELLALAVLSYGFVIATVVSFALAVNSPNPIVCLVAAWAFVGIHQELSDPVKLNNPLRYNPSIWDETTLGGMQDAAFAIYVISAIMALVAAFRNCCTICCCKPRRYVLEKD